MRYLVLGSSSFYGSNFVKFLKERGESVQGLARPQFDLGKDFSLPSSDVIVNFIAENTPAESWEDPERWLQTNIIYQNRLFEEIRKKEISLYVHISTPEVYGSNAHWLKERKDYLPLTPSAVSRACSDMLLQTYWRAYRFPMIITRTTNVYGPGQQETRLIPKAFRLLSQGEKFTVFGTGRSQRSFIHVRDACRGLYILSKDGKPGEHYHISTQKQYSILEVVRMICKILGKGEVEFKLDKVGKEHAYLLNSDKMRALGWHDQIELNEGLREYASQNGYLEDQRKFKVETIDG